MKIYIENYRAGELIERVLRSIELQRNAPLLRSTMEIGNPSTENYGESPPFCGDLYNTP